MQPRQRPYQEEDFWRIRAFLRETLILNDYREFNWHVARFEYWRWHGVANLEHFRLEEVVCVWEDADGRIAAVLNPEGKGEAFLHWHPALRPRDLLVEMLDTAEARLASPGADGRPKLRVWAHQDDHPLRDELARRGYAAGAWPEFMRRGLLSSPVPDAPLPPGYVVRPLGDGLELLERCYASGLAFHENDIAIAVDNRNDPAWYRNIQTAPLYRRDFDIVAIAPDGAVASFCTVWFDDVTRTGVFEPVATVPAHQRRGLGRAVMTEGLRRLARAGATRAYVGSYSAEAGALYAAMGFTEYDLLEPWEKGM
jgi:GNAT superfamily N-acetyltransferase